MAMRVKRVFFIIQPCFFVLIAGSSRISLWSLLRPPILPVRDRLPALLHVQEKNSSDFLLLVNIESLQPNLHTKMPRIAEIRGREIGRCLQISQRGS
jgi:hypothetical protein